MNVYMHGLMHIHTSTGLQNINCWIFPVKQNESPFQFLKIYILWTIKNLKGII